ncbi:MAG: T9SS type A sorting domain-containing protein [Fluviicola sp.]
MKKIYLFGLSLVAISAVNGQIQKNYEAKKMNTIGEKAPKVSFSESKAIPFYTNNFSVPTDWTHVANATHTSGDWAISTDVNEIPVTALAPAAHPTAANGYALINSDAAGNGEVQNADFRTTANINCSTHPTVNLIFKQSTRHYQETYFVIVSNDGGATWTEFPVNTDLPVNTNTANPRSTQVNITSVAGGQANVRIGFRYVGTFDWFWAVDDVEMAELEANDVSLNSIYWGTVGSWGPRLPYYKTPLNQVSDVIFSGVAKNNGSADQTVTFGGAIPTPAYASASTPALLPVSASDTFDLSVAFAPTAVGAFAFTGTVTNGTDANPADNTLPAINFAVVANDYSRTTATATSGLFNQGNKYVMGNIYDIIASDDATGVKAFIASTSVAGSLMSYRIYEIDAAGDFVLLSGAETDLYEVTAADLGTVVTLYFPSSIPLTAGNSYLVAVNTPGSGGVGNDIVLGANGVSEEQTTFLRDETDTWFYMTTTPMVDLTFQTASIDESVNSFGVSVYPNPASDEVKVSFNLNGAAAATVNVIDMTGKVVASQEAAAGSNAVSINTSNLSAGVYSVSFTANNTTVTKKLVVKK